MKDTTTGWVIACVLCFILGIGIGLLWDADHETLLKFLKHF
jgi:hypothetical protein